MSKDSEDVGENVKEGLGLLWKAAKQAAKDVKREVTATTVSKTLEDAGREVARAATNVAEKLGAEIKKITPRDPDWAEPDDERMKPPYDKADPDPDAPPAGDKPAKPRGPTPSDPGFRIAVDDDDERKR